MDHLSSRFRRSKRASPAPTPATQEPSPALSSDDTNPTPAVPATGDRASKATRTTSPPVLSITTTPPRSKDNGSNGIANTLQSLHPPKSPFRGFHHFRSAHKRARSPAPASLPVPTSPAIVNQDGTVEHSMTPTTGAHSPNGDSTPIEKHKIPYFLTLSPSDIETKFHELTWMERLRIQQSHQNPSPQYQFARVTDPETKILDRYANIQPWANNRVRLQVPEGEVDYINASPIVLESPLKPKDRPPHRYIAMQGPKFNTMDHVWRMIAEQLQSPAVIVMLTETHEMGMEKCYSYFPRDVDEPPLEIGEDDEFGDGFRAVVTCKSVEEKAKGAIEMREIKIHVDGREEDMTVWHLLYRKWPDFGVPALEDIDSFFELMRLSREKNASEENPRIIHCSAGVGRSGTFIALEHLMREVESGDLAHYDDMGGAEDSGSTSSGSSPDLVFETVNALREQRRQMVQAESQYLFIYQVLRKQWMEKYGVQNEPGDEPAAKRLEVNHDPFIED